MNRLLIFSFEEISAPLEFNEETKVKKLDRFQALTWIRGASLSEGQSIVSGVAIKFKGSFKPLSGSHINSET